MDVLKLNVHDSIEVGETFSCVSFCVIEAVCVSSMFSQEDVLVVLPHLTWVTALARGPGFVSPFHNFGQRA